MPATDNPPAGRTYRWLVGVIVPILAATIAAGYWRFGIDHNSPLPPTEVSDASGTRTSVTASPSTIRPSAPADLAVSASTYSTITLTWKAPVPAGLASSYDIYRGTVRVGSTAGTSFTDGIDSGGRLTAGAHFTYKVIAISPAGSASDPAVATGQTKAPDLILTQMFNADDQAPKHRLTTTGDLPYGFTTDATWRVLSAAGPDETEIFFCSRTLYADYFISTARNCEGWQTTGSFFISTIALPGTRQLYRCVSNSLNDHMVTTDTICHAEGSKAGTYHVETTILGYVWPNP